jgi:DNA primase
VITLDELSNQPGGGTVFIFEGEKCADIGTKLGLVATTTAHGSKCPHKTDLTPLAGRTIVIVADHDEAGEGYVRKLCLRFKKLDPQPTVYVLRLPGLTGDGDDIEQWLELPDTPKTRDEIRQELVRLAAELTPEDLATIEPEPEPEKILPEPDRDPHRLARVILAKHTDSSGHRLLVSYHGEIYRYHEDSYREDPDFFQREMVQLIKEELDRCYQEAWQRYESQPADGTKKLKPPTLVPVTQRLCGDVYHALRSIISINRPEQPPFWIDPRPGDLDPINLLPMQNGLLDISRDPPQLFAHTHTRILFRIEPRL